MNIPSNLPSFYDSPAPREESWSIDNKTYAKSFWVMPAQQPDQILEHLIVHTRQCEIVQVKYNAQVVYYFFKTSFACILLTRK